MTQLYKYKRTKHVPWSPGATSDDKIMDLHSLIHYFNGKRVVITEKADGENTTMYPDHIHARSLDSKHHESRNWVKGLWGSIKHQIPSGWRICGENLFAQHSIKYDDLESYFYVFSIWDDFNECLSWVDTVIICESLGLTPVRVLYDGQFDLQLLQGFHNTLDLSKQEGYVMRTYGSFSYHDFDEAVVKWVRKNHVTTDEHWMFSQVIPNKLKNK